VETRLNERHRPTSDQVSLAWAVPKSEMNATPHADATPRWGPRLVVGLCLLWAFALMAGFVALRLYGAQPGEEVTAAETIPADLPEVDGMELVMVVHPKCSCTRASLRELARLATELKGALRPVIVFLHPHEPNEEWRRSDLYAAALRVPDVVVIDDVGGVIASRLGATTSGSTHLFGPDGRLLFQGGLTPSRSHEGDSVGRQQILALVQTGRSRTSRSAVYGCALATKPLTTLSTLWQAVSP